MMKKIYQTKTQTLNSSDTARCYGIHVLDLSLEGYNGKGKEVLGPLE